VNTNTLTLVDDDGALTLDGYAALQAASAAVRAARRHPGGREAGWFRLMNNQYTVNPTRPCRDDADREKECLEDAAKALVCRCIDGGAVSILEADVRGWPWKTLSVPEAKSC
jgi:hypothetical protein